MDLKRKGLKLELELPPCQWLDMVDNQSEYPRAPLQQDSTVRTVQVITNCKTIQLPACMMHETTVE